ncbi:MAG: restriction endonuclease subunit S [Bryobacterales bacterium]|nr:restriction endonuclease subunit S [Bryobacterales bacterium]
MPVPLVPTLRFPEFRNGPRWDLLTLSSASDVNPSNDGLPEFFIYIDLESVKSSMLIGRKEISRDAAPSRAQRLLSRKDIIYQTVRPYQRNNLLFDIDDGYEYVASTGYAQLRAHECPEFLYQLLHTDSFVNSVLARCTGSNYPSINPSALASIRVALPRKPEQHKIADCLGSLDDLIAAEGRKLEALWQHKLGLMQQLFPQAGETIPRLRFPEFAHGPVWDHATVADLVETVTPPRKLTTSTYLPDGRFPIIDQSQNYICGWTNDNEAVITRPLPVIVFGDHTCVLKFVNRTFAQGADGVKILTARRHVSTLFLYHQLKYRPVVMEGYKRHFSALKDRVVFFPDTKSGEQQKIADCLGSLEDVLAAQARKIDTLRQQKQGLLQQLFPSLVTK